MRTDGSADDAARASADAEVTEEVVVLLSARAQEEARGFADDGDFASAKQRLAGAGQALRRMATGSKHAGDLLAQAGATESRADSLSHESCLMERRRMSFENRELRQRKLRPGSEGKERS